MYLVTGATGQVGERIVRELRHLGHPVRAFVRLQSTYERLEHWGAEICIGDLQYQEDLERACEGVEAIISAHGVSDTQSSQTLIEALDFRANVRLIQIARTRSIRHFVYISVLGSVQFQHESPLFRAKAEVERLLQSTDIGYTILRPSGLASNIARLAETLDRTGIYPLIGEGRNRSSIVSNDDLAKIAALAPTTPTAHRTIFAVGGPQILRRDQIPTLVGEILNKDPFILLVPLDVFDVGQWILSTVNPELGESLKTLRTLLAHEYYCTSEQINYLQTTFGLTLEPLESYLRRHLDIA